MGVAKMTGQIDGVAIVFYQTESGEWAAVVPPDLYGEFVVEVTAWDEAGNTAYSTAMLFVIDTRDLSYRVIPLSYAYKVVDHGFLEKEIRSDYTFHVVGMIKV